MTGAGAFADTPTAAILQAVLPATQAAATLRITSPRDMPWQKHAPLLCGEVKRMARLVQYGKTRFHAHCKKSATKLC